MSDLPLALQPPDPAVKIRPVRLSDTLDLHAQCWPDRPYSAVYQLVMRAQRLTRQRRGLGVVVIGNSETIKGYGQLTLWPECAELSDLIVAAPYRRQGLGTVIIQYLVQTAQTMHISCVEIGAALSNPGAIALYRRLGFEDSHKMRMNLGNGHEPVLFLRLAIPGG